MTNIAMLLRISSTGWLVLLSLSCLMSSWTGTSSTTSLTIMISAFSSSSSSSSNLRPSSSPPASQTKNKDQNKLKRKIRAISLDITGTLITTREPVIQSYYDALVWSNFPNPPTQQEMKAAFKIAYKERCIEAPCFGGGTRGSNDSTTGSGGREWWKETVRRVLYHSGRSLQTNDYTEEQFDRYFRRVYQHFGSPNGYMVLDDAAEFLNEIQQRQQQQGHDALPIVLGITSNTPTRHIESVLPMLDIHNHFYWFSCAQDVGYEKPSVEIFDHAYRQAKYWVGGESGSNNNNNNRDVLQKDEILHVGDSLACDYCGAKAYGFDALYLDRSRHPANITSYQDWIDAPEYPGKDDDTIDDNTITNLMEIFDKILP